MHIHTVIIAFFRQVGTVCAAVTEQAAGTLGIFTVGLLEVGRVPRDLDGQKYDDVDIRFALKMMP